MTSDVKTVSDYLKSLAVERRQQIEKVRQVILKYLPEGYEEGMQYGMIGYYVPLSIYPQGYLNDGKTPLPFASLASQKNHMAVYLSCIYSDLETSKWFLEQYKKSGKKMDIGKSCVRFKRLEDLPLDLIGETIAKVPVKEFIKQYESSRS